MSLAGILWQFIFCLNLSGMRWLLLPSKIDSSITTLTSYKKVLCYVEVNQHPSHAFHSFCLILCSEVTQTMSTLLAQDGLLESCKQPLSRHSTVPDTRVCTQYILLLFLSSCIHYFFSYVKYPT